MIDVSPLKASLAQLIDEYAGKITLESYVEIRLAVDKVLTDVRVLIEVIKATRKDNPVQ